MILNNTIINSIFLSPVGESDNRKIIASMNNALSHCYDSICTNVIKASNDQQGKYLLHSPS